jgi:hypothetical protein
MLSVEIKSIILNVIMLVVVMLNVILLNVVILNVVILNIVVPFLLSPCECYGDTCPYSYQFSYLICSTYPNSCNSLRNF